MRASVFKLTVRSIRSFFGRYLALVLIVMLSVGFFAGLKVTKAAMAGTCNTYLSEQKFYDYRLISTIGFQYEDVVRLGTVAGVDASEGSKSGDAMVTHDGVEEAFRLMSLPEKINLPSLIAGRLPEIETECLGDAKYFTEEDIGSVIQISTEETEGILLSGTEFTIVGIVNSPLYLGTDRGSASLGGGETAGFLYLTASAFESDIYTEIFLTLSSTGEAYSEEYEQLIEEKETDISAEFSSCAEERYEKLLEESGLTTEQAKAAGIEEPRLYLLTREDNSGYISFENDTSIISGIANIFPFFFILIAMLVCITTMTRMVDEERTQIGVLKAMGYSDAHVTAKYMLYAGSAEL